MATTAYWTLIPCTPTVAADNAWVSECAMVEGASDAQHSHWLNPDGVETVTEHPAGARTAPNCYVRTQRTG